MNPEDIHAWVAEQVRTQRRAKNEVVPSGTDLAEWDRRYRISLRLEGETYQRLQAYCQEHGFSVNSAIKALIKSLPETA